MCANDFVVMDETVVGLWYKFRKWKEAFDCNGLNINLGKTKVMVRGIIAEDGLSKSKVDPFMFCSLTVM